MQTHQRKSDKKITWTWNNKAALSVRSNNPCQPPHGVHAHFEASDPDAASERARWHFRRSSQRAENLVWEAVKLPITQTHTDKPRKRGGKCVCRLIGGITVFAHYHMLTAPMKARTGVKTVVGGGVGACFVALRSNWVWQNLIGVIFIRGFSKSTLSGWTIVFNKSLRRHHTLFRPKQTRYASFFNSYSGFVCNIFQIFFFFLHHFPPSHSDLKLIRKPNADGIKRNLNWVTFKASVSVSCIFQCVINQIKCVGSYSVSGWNRNFLCMHLISETRINPNPSFEKPGVLWKETAQCGMYAPHSRFWPLVQVPVQP